MTQNMDLLPDSANTIKPRGGGIESGCDEFGRPETMDAPCTRLRLTHCPSRDRQRHVSIQTLDNFKKLKHGVGAVKRSLDRLQHYNVTRILLLNSVGSHIDTPADTLNALFAEAVPKSATDRNNTMSQLTANLTIMKQRVSYVKKLLQHMYVEFIKIITRLNVDTERGGIDTEREGIDAERGGIDTEREGIDTERGGIDTERGGIGGIGGRHMVLTNRSFVDMFGEFLEHTGRFSHSDVQFFVLLFNSKGSN
jgi:hypothetical protein